LLHLRGTACCCSKSKIYASDKIYQSLKEVPSQLGAEMVVQRYIYNPLLVNGLKFDLRVYVVIVGTDPLSAYICSEGLARFCTVVKSDYMK
jgi:hypothetical protein